MNKLCISKQKRCSIYGRGQHHAAFNARNAANSKLISQIALILFYFCVTTFCLRIIFADLEQ